jgi:membrane protein DedA with SNARE-associated domain
MMRMGFVRFVVLTTVGSLVWNVLLIGAGYQLRSRWEEVSELVGRYSDIALVALGAAALAGAYLLVRRRLATRG